MSWAVHALNPVMVVGLQVAFEQAASLPRDQKQLVAMVKSCGLYNGYVVISPDANDYRTIRRYLIDHRISAEVEVGAVSLSVIRQLRWEPDCPAVKEGTIPLTVAIFEALACSR